jgi:hypothetical protein
MVQVLSGKLRAVNDWQSSYTDKVNFSLCLINEALCNEDIWGSGGIAPPFLTSVLDGGEWSTSRHRRFTPGEIISRHLLDRRLGGSQNRSGRCDEEKNLSMPELEPGPSSP